MLDRVEEVSERVLEGFFRRSAGLQPVDIAKRLVREMLRRRTVSVSSVYVPNTYLVRLSPADWEAIAPFRESLAAEMAGYLEQQAASRRLTLVGPVRVELEVEEELSRGSLTIHAGMQEPLETAGPRGIHDTLVYRPGERSTGWVLVVEEGPRAGDTMPVPEGRVTVGRGSGCDILLHDPQVSRRHATLEARDGHLLLEDLGSSNGTLVNGQRVERRRLRAGDRVAMGQTVLRVETD